MATGVVSWSQTAATNATADSTVNWAEGQAPSSVNDSARATMASVAKYRDDIAGAIVTGGTGAAYTVTSNQGFGSLAAMNGQIIAFTPGATNTGTVTLNVDSLGAKPLRSAPSVELPAGTLVLGTPYLALYNNSDAAFYLHGFFGNPYGIMIGGMVDFIGTTAPNSSFVLPFGQAISRTTYSVLFGLVSTTFGVGDGSTTFNIIDMRGRVSAGKDDMGGSAASRITSLSTDGGTIVGATLGSTGGSQSHALTTGEMPVHNHGITDGGHTHAVSGASKGTSTTAGGLPYGGSANSGTLTTFSTDSNTTGITINNAGSGSNHALLQPTMICNKLLRII